MADFRRDVPWGRDRNGNQVFLTDQAQNFLRSITTARAPNGDWVFGSELETTAESGFVFIPTCSGTPTGIPTARPGLVPLVYDITNDILYAYNGGWVAVS